MGKVDASAVAGLDRLAIIRNGPSDLVTTPVGLLVFRDDAAAAVDCSLARTPHERFAVPDLSDSSLVYSLFVPGAAIPDRQVLNEGTDPNTRLLYRRLELPRSVRALDTLLGMVTASCPTVASFAAPGEEYIAHLLRQ